MQLTEIKNDLATMNYNPELNRLMISDFILIEDANQSILAQIISIEGTDDADVNSAMLKFLLSIDKDANLTQYLGYVPAKNATLLLINPQEVVQLIKNSEKNIYIGNLAAYPDIQVELGLDFLRKKTYVQVDFLENKLQIVEAIIRGLTKYNRKTLLFDFSGLYSGLTFPEIMIGDNFKLPLNYEALYHIAEEELNDCNNDNRATIQAILLEVQNYVKSTEDGFIPFNTFISVLDAQYEESAIPELLLLKNKLMKYQQQGIFAQNKSEFDFINSFLKDNKNIKINLSELPVQWHKIAFISILNLLKSKCYLITDFTDDNSNKTIIKKLYEKSEIRPIVISSYGYKYQIQLKAMSKNLILFKPQQQVNDFAGYTSFLNILGQDTFIVWGEQTLFIPLILKMSNVFKKFEIFAPKKELKTKPEKEVIQETEAPTLTVSENEPQYEEPHIADTQNTEQPLVIDYGNSESSSPIEYTPDNISSAADSILNEDFDIPNNDVISDIQSQDLDISDASSDIVINNNTDASSENNLIINDDENFQDLPNPEDMDFFFEGNNPEEIIIDEAENVDSSNITIDIPNSENDINTEINDLPLNTQIDELPIKTENENIISDLDEIKIDENLNQIEQNNEIITSDVIDNVQDKKALDDIIPQEPVAEAQEQIIPQVNENKPVAEEKAPTMRIPQPNQTVKSAEVPVYSSNAAPQFDAKFAQGTYVHHPKYGRGVVEKVINYGAKQLCLIIFDNEGRKLLDPNIAELKQV